MSKNQHCLRVTRWLSGALLAAVALYGQAQNDGAITGRVTAQTGSPLHDATVVLLPSGRSLQTSNTGEFQFRGLPPGRYDLLAHLHGFSDERVSVEVAVGKPATAEIRLSFAALRQEITVTASGREETVLETFSSVTSLDGQQLTLRNSAPALGEILENEPGVAKRSYGPGSSRPVIRGFDGDRVLILQDGTRTGTLSSQSGDHGEPVDTSQVERVEIVRGPGTLMYGTNAVGGVVNVITRHHELEQHPHAGIRGHLKALAGSNNGLGGGGGGFEFGKRDWLFWGMGSGQRTGNYKTPLGQVENSFSNIAQTSAGLGRYGTKGFFTLSYGVQDGRYGVPPAEAEHDHDHDHDHEHEEEGHGHGHEDVNIDWRRHNVRFHGGWRNLDGWLESFRATVNYSDWRHFEVEGDEIATRFSNNQWTWQGMFQQAKRGLLSGSFGGFAMHRDFKTTGAEALAPPVRQNSYALFAVEELSFERLRVQFGGRLEHNGYNLNGALPDRSFTGASGSIGLYASLWNGGAAVLNYTSSYRAPALEELYNFGPHLGNLAFEVGNPNLRRERAHGVEASLRHRGSRLRAEISGYYNRMLDFVFLAPTGEIEDGLIEAEYDQAGARYLGAEARLDVMLRQDLWLNLGFDAVDAQLRDTRTPLPRIPPVRGRIGFDWRRGGFNVRPEVALANRQWQIFPTETPTAGYAFVNLLGSYTFAGPHVTHMFGVNAFNLNDKLYRNHLSFIKEFAPEIGRGVRFSYTLNFY
jgi:iron complex outermembrane receptor protein